MGNTACCASGDLFEVDSQEERYICETIKNFSNEIVKEKDFIKICSECFGLQIIEIEGEPLEWITKDSYQEFFQKFYPEKDTKDILRFMKLPYGKIDVSEKEYKNNYHLLLLIWIIGISKDKTISLQEKKKLIKEIIRKTTKVLTFRNFFKFIFTFFEIMFVDVTLNFKSFSPNGINDLVGKTYNIQNINDYVENLNNSMFNIIKQEKKQITLNSVQNEFLNDDMIDTFFEKNNYLLDAVKLRENFYSIYANGIKNNFINEK